MGCVHKEKFVAILEKRWGKPIGYKAALTSEAAQRNFGVREPVRGVLLADIMLKNGAKLPAKFGALPRYEADLIVIVADFKSPLMRVSSHSPLKPNMAPT